jgi:hypothetical protein
MYSNKHFAATGLFLNFYFYSRIALRLCLSSLLELAMKRMQRAIWQAPIKEGNPPFRALRSRDFLLLNFSFNLFAASYFLPLTFFAPALFFG